MTAEAVVMDTDVASLTMRGALPESLRRELERRAPCVAFVTVGELFRGAAHAGWGDRRVGALHRWLQRVAVLEAGAAVAERWGAITGRALREGRPLPANDAWIAACCLANGVPLATLNVRDYDRIEQLELI